MIYDYFMSQNMPLLVKIIDGLDKHHFLIYIIFEFIKKKYASFVTTNCHISGTLSIENININTKGLFHSVEMHLPAEILLYGSLVDVPGISVLNPQLQQSMK